MVDERNDTLSHSYEATSHDSLECFTDVEFLDIIDYLKHS
jgi:hypothetical protein